MCFCGGRKFFCGFAKIRIYHSSFWDNICYNKDLCFIVFESYELFVSFESGQL